MEKLKRKGGAEKLRAKKFKKLATEAKTCCKITDLFEATASTSSSSQGQGQSKPGTAATHEDEAYEQVEEEGSSRRRHLLTITGNEVLTDFGCA